MALSQERTREQTLDQQRAAYSLETVDDVKQKVEQKKSQEGDQGDEYAGYVVNLAGSILINGLGQALAQLRAAAKNKKDDPHGWLYRHVHLWICEKHPHSPFHGKKDLLQALMTGSRQEYQWALTETMAFLEWHRKIAVAELKKIDSGGGEEKNDEA
ncbi:MULTISPECIES: type III-B CRISPR module-associated protein Cmr5 [unclassified Thermoactinomyces]|jgi:CRISPR-associated protein Cmr5|uniref:type III-B CRISPR module-associated protein Cmr5 n=1 Tax=unclassified Thermoactinomyces TaxID=2634588 RepID=UPI0018DDAADF|nr:MULTISPECIES: type III-B CRISPR module-associated protein Cmr5 [unclassified Thermoactinomyces]MBH8599292.1 type III-B CRISPR module-associated protein Cmr5 [Thermoactinomyces sp. CICC 10523]MBH8605352.1 type III-B CRISPR module-associated protein Cmr5 [Thermoactinomyces sp. CICC 10522]MBH8608809.1 type III-B CRISPR module-associated protein Cmr5 [Thermoactinomyces sp. CICC 10521]